MEFPLVSVICLCYNQEQFVREAVKSVLNQTYPNIQLIVVDDASTDQSANLIRELKEEYPSLHLKLLERNVGNCTAFNRGLALASGEYIIDLAADDVLMPERISKQVSFFKTLDESYGVVFSDAIYIDSDGKELRDHFGFLFKKGLLSAVPQGEVYRDVLSKYFIPSPTMMIRKAVFNVIGGYDEQLVYEDFDFWVRSSRLFKYGFINEPLTKIRRTGKSMSSGWYKRGDRQLHSTYLVCCKAAKLNRDEMDREALLIRIRYELRQAVFSGNRPEAGLFFDLLSKLEGIRFLDAFTYHLRVAGIPLNWVRTLYHQVRFGT